MNKGVVFDLDDTLLSEREYVKSGFKEISKEIKESFKIEDENIYEKMLSLFYESSKNIFNRILDYYEVTYKEEDIKALVKSYRNHSPIINFYDDVIETLKILREKGYKLGIITDGYKESQRKKLEALNCYELFDEIIITDELGKEFWKPNSRAFEIMAKKLNCNYRDLSYIGDNERKDFLAANKLGMRTYKIFREGAIYGNIPKIEEQYLAKNNLKNLIELVEYL